MGVTSFLSETGLTNLEFVRTGDVLLFTSEPQKGALLVMTSTRSIWTHVGIAVWTDEIPRRLMILESAFGVKRFDELTGTDRVGVRLTNLATGIERYQMVHVRNVNVARDSNFYTKLADFMQIWKGTNYVSLVNIPLIPFIRFDDHGVSCAEFVARFFQYMGLFDDKPQLNSYPIKNFLPRHFSPGTGHDIDTSGLFTRTFSPIVYRSPHARFDTIRILSAVTIGLTLIGFYVLFINAETRHSI